MDELISLNRMFFTECIRQSVNSFYESPEMDANKNNPYVKYAPFNVCVTHDGYFLGISMSESYDGK